VDAVSRYYDRQGEPITLHQWGELMNDDEYRQVARTKVGPYLVSTVWLGLDHNVLGKAPLIFETMVFEGERDDLEMQRYSTEKQALLGHDVMVQQVSEWSEP
jgi:hypothetical protein